MTSLEIRLEFWWIVVDNKYRDGRIMPYPTRTTQQKDATMKPYQKFNAFTTRFNPSRGQVEVFLCSIYARSLSDAKKEKEVWERGEVRIVRPAK